MLFIVSIRLISNRFVSPHFSEHNLPSFPSHQQSDILLLSHLIIQRSLFLVPSRVKSSRRFPSCVSEWTPSHLIIIESCIRIFKLARPVSAFVVSQESVPLLYQNFHFCTTKSAAAVRLLERSQSRRISSHGKSASGRVTQCISSHSVFVSDQSFSSHVSEHMPVSFLS